MKPPDKRAIKLGGASVVVAVLALRVGPWGARAYAALSEQARVSVLAANRAQGVLADGPAIRESLAQTLAAVVRLAPQLVEGRTGAEAAATLTGLVAVAANQHALRVVRLDPAPDSGGGIFARVAVRAELEGDTRGLGRWLHAIEAGDPVLTVPRLQVSALDPTNANGTVERLRIEATITGLYWPRPAP